jgi:type III secretion protein J
MSKHWWCVLGLCAVLAACGRVDQRALSTVPEGQTTEIVSLLMRDGIVVQLEPAAKEGEQTLYVKDADMVRAYALMKEAGLPRSKAPRLSELFRKDGMVTTPFEERVRFMAGLGQELEQMLGRIEGVVSVRVNVTPAAGTDRLGLPQVGSAAVYLKCLSTATVIDRSADLRALVSKSVPGLTEEAVALFIEPVMPRAVLDAASGHASAAQAPSALLLAAAGVMLGVALGIGAMLARERVDREALAGRMHALRAAALRLVQRKRGAA